MGSKTTAGTLVPYPTGDFFDYEELLRPEERLRLQSVRDWLEAEVRPIAGDHWNRSVFPQHLIPKIAELDIISPVRRQG